MKLFFSMLLFVGAVLATPPGTPEKKPPPPAMKEKHPILPELTNWGDIKQDKEHIELNGPHWEATGYLHFDRVIKEYRLVLYWKERGRVDSGPSLYAYDMTSDSWKGVWGWEYNEVEIVIEKGEISITGKTNRDELKPLKVID